MSTERAFFPTMEEFGFFSHIYEKLPQDFTAIFEIARILKIDLRCQQGRTGDPLVIGCRHIGQGDR